MSDVSETHAPAFPHTTGRTRGYRPDAVDAFLARARTAFEDGEATDIDSTVVRTAAFPLVRHGYQVSAVDAALSRIEDAFAAREREQALSRRGARAWVGQSRQLAQEVLDRLTRPRGHRFRRVGALRFGYRVDEVDLVADKIARFLESGEPVTVDQVRSVAFRMQRRGYSEAQVDAVLDATVEVMLAVV
ncbi:MULTISPECIES: DivIVA domain-containing protein [Microbacterium]|uniref:DivIVA domain-containing protein n=1 Tax=Microbacterium hominis TaxID=162426 RepID=A0A134DL14_9MICO|nr:MULTISPECIES: DivIVA domain-containing protein [Microbacterium]AUG29679.1 DivIVA domain-containing protein [Microbacterium hominis]KXC07234.1 MFS transporter permease [Microbacterium hominis]QOC25389.1 DivIVA domain-containing protein [Microbacterium hominis]QYF98260.1 DivIVA domain-containing protein [Microbacterium sp. PAMC21962]